MFTGLVVACWGPAWARLILRRVDFPHPEEIPDSGVPPYFAASQVEDAVELGVAEVAV